MPWLVNRRTTSSLSGVGNFLNHKRGSVVFLRHTSVIRTNALANEWCTRHLSRLSLGMYSECQVRTPHIEASPVKNRAFHAFYIRWGLIVYGEPCVQNCSNNLMDRSVVSSLCPVLLVRGKKTHHQGFSLQTVMLVPWVALLPDQSLITRQYGVKTKRLVARQY
ncbi:hypothetical protein BDW62DRAFT_188329, partial [Aspergillus aurantiobrunneus]